MKKLTIILIAVLLAGCTLPSEVNEMLEGIVVTPTQVGVIATATPTVTPVIITATPEPTYTPTATQTPDPDFVPSPTPILDVKQECDWKRATVMCVASQCNVRLAPMPGEANVAYTVPKDTSLTVYASCMLGNEEWLYAGVNANNDELWLRSLNTIWQ